MFLLLILKLFAFFLIKTEKSLKPNREFLVAMPCTTKALDSLVEQKMTFNSMAAGTSVSGSIQDSRTDY